MLVVVDLRDPIGLGAARVNVSRRAHSNDFSFERALGNPFVVRQGEAPGTAAAKFRSWLWDRLSNDEDGNVVAALERIEAMLELGSVELGCWCGGRSTCHAHVIARCIAWRATQRPAVVDGLAPYVDDPLRRASFTHHRDILAAVVDDPRPDELSQAAARDLLDALTDEHDLRKAAGELPLSGFDWDLYTSVRDRVRSFERIA